MHFIASPNPSYPWPIFGTANTVTFADTKTVYDVYHRSLLYVFFEEKSIKKEKRNTLYAG